MRPRWKLLVEGLGRIGRAEVEVHPLMLFVGENNTGKSYLATLLWGLLVLQGSLLWPGTEISSPEFKKVDDWLLERLRDHPGGGYVLTAQDEQLLQEWFSGLLQRRGNVLLQSSFNVSSIKASRLEVHPDRRRSGVALHDIEVALDDAMSRYKFLRQLASHIIFGDLAAPVEYSPARQSPRQAVFLPASRTGFMLLYRAVVAQQIGRLHQFPASQPGLDRIELTTPAIHLLSILASGIRDERGPYADEADFLEAALHGSVELKADVGVNDYRYRPEGAGASLTMALSSSLVTELSPVILVLRHLSDFPVLILEEPEAHLHPRLQRKLAQVIVRLIRKGLYVWITTHSENFCQQINNFLRIGTSPERGDLQRELGYGEQDYLELDDVAGYQFQMEGETSVVSPLEKSEEGLTMPTFNSELINLAKETLLLQRRGRGES